MLEKEPGPALSVVAVALTLAAAPLGLNHTRSRPAVRTGSAVLLGIGSILTGFSFGLFYVPSAVAMTIAAVRGVSRPGTDGRAAKGTYAANGVNGHNGVVAIDESGVALPRFVAARVVRETLGLGGRGHDDDGP